MKHSIIIIFSIFFFACNVNKQVVTNNNDTNRDKNEFLQIDCIEDNLQGIKFNVKNINDKDVFIFNPERLHIEKFDGNTWNKIRILPCPCGAPCARPEEIIVISSGKTFHLHWDKIESWCGKKNSLGFQETIKQNSSKGLYRIRILYGVEKRDKKIMYKEFSIINK